MKNFWLDRKGPKKTRINIWLSASIANDAFEMEDRTTEKLVDFCDIETAQLQSSAVTNKFTPEGTNEMLSLLRVGKAVGPKGLGADFSQHLDAYHRTSTQWYKKADWPQSLDKAIAQSNKEIGEAEAAKVKESAFVEPATKPVKI